MADICVCGRLIPATSVYYAFELDPEADAQYAYINEWHDHCLSEWGWRRDDSAWGIAHVTCPEQADDDIDPRSIG